MSHMSRASSNAAPKEYWRMTKPRALLRREDLAKARKAGCQQPVTADIQSTCDEDKNQAAGEPTDLKLMPFSNVPVFSLPFIPSIFQSSIGPTLLPKYLSVSLHERI